MIELDALTDLDAEGVLAEAERAQDAMVAAETGRFFLAAHWVDLHSGEALAEERRRRGERVLPGMERATRVGAHGTPLVAEFAAMELGAVLGMGPVAAGCFVRDAVNTRHRHPVLWAALAAGRARVWQAREVARRCAAAGLDRDQARWVDTVTTPYLGSLPWGRFESLLEARIVEADPAAAEERARAAALDRFVRTGQSSEFGLKTLVARAAAGDVVFFVAMVDRIAQILLLKGDTDRVDVRRSKAIGILATPARALWMLQQAEADAASADRGAGDGASDSDGDASGESAEDRAGDDAGEASGDEPSSGGDEADADRGAAPGSSAGETSSESEDGVAGDDAGDVSGDEPSGEGDGAAASRDGEEGEDPDLIGELDVHPADNDADDPEPATAPCPTCAGDGTVTGDPTPFVKPGLAGLAGQTGLADVDPRRLLPNATLYIHVSEAALRSGVGVARMEGVGPLTIGQVKEFLGHTNVRPVRVVDLAGQVPVDGYEVPAGMREALYLRNPACVAPYATNLSRGKDADHVVPYLSPDRGGPPGQTALGNLGLLARFAHRVKTHGRWSLRQPSPGVFEWRSPHGYWFRVDHTGTHYLGKTPDPRHPTAPAQEQERAEHRSSVDVWFSPFELDLAELVGHQS